MCYIEDILNIVNSPSHENIFRGKKMSFCGALCSLTRQMEIGRNVCTVHHMLQTIVADLNNKFEGFRFLKLLYASSAVAAKD